MFSGARYVGCFCVAFVFQNNFAQNGSCQKAHVELVTCRNRIDECAIFCTCHWPLVKILLDRTIAFQLTGVLDVLLRNDFKYGDKMNTVMFITIILWLPPHIFVWVWSLYLL